MFPQLVPTDSEGRSYAGFITAAGRDCAVRITNIDPQRWNPATVCIECDPDVRTQLQGFEGVVQQRLKQSASLNDFLVELVDVISRVSAPASDALVTGDNAGNGASLVLTKLVAELDAIGWQRISSLDASLSTLDLSYVDAAQRTHVLRIRVTDRYPSVAPVCVADLPEAFEPQWNAASGTLGLILQQFEARVDALQPFWDKLAELDAACWVLEPQQPSLGANFRRIAIGNHSSLQLEFDATQPGTAPTRCVFLGPDHVIGPLREAYYRNVSEWSKQKSIAANLEHVLSCELPSPATSSKDDFSIECGICYAFRLGDAVPDKVCDDPRCAKPFHQSCLFDWLVALPDRQQSFDTVFGTCPYCEHAISAKGS